MGLASMMGWDNPFTQFVSDNNSALMGFGAGLASGKTPQQGLAQGLGAMAQMAPVDAERAEKARLLQEQVDKKSKYVELFTNAGMPDLAAFIEGGGDGNTAFSEMWKRQQPQPADDYLKEVNGQLVDTRTGDVFGDYRTPEAAPAASNLPTSYDEYLLAKDDPGYAAALNSSTTRAPTEGRLRNQQLATVVEPQAKIVMDNWADLTDPTNQMIGINTPAGAPFLAGTSSGYQQATSALKTIAQSYLYSVSGAAATNDETQKIIDSVTPKFGESKASADNKKALIARMVQSIREHGGSATSAPGGGGGDPIAAADALLNSGKY